MKQPQEQHRRALRGLASFVCLAALALAAQSSRAGTETPPPLRLTLAEALERAFSSSPVVQARRAEVRRAEARLLGARTYPFNPELELATGDRQGPIESSTDRGLGISQEIQIGGQRRKGIATASAALEAARSSFERELRLLGASVEQAFAEAVRARELLEIAEADAELARQLLRFSVRRLEAGSGTQVELNLARSTAGQAERALRLSESAEATARNRLAELIGLPADGRLGAVVGDQPMPDDRMPQLEELVPAAIRNRADLAALRHETASAERAIELSRSLRIPNLRLGAFYEEEERTDEVKGIGLSVPIPLFNRNQGGVAEAQAEAERLSAEGAAAELTVRREVADALVQYRSAREAALYLRDLVVGTLEENLTLVRKALDAGKIAASDVLVFRREFVEGQRQYVEALFEARSARIALDLATGRTPIQPDSAQESLP